MLDFKELDHEFLTEGNPAADKENAAALIQNNLTEEEQNKLREMMPIVEQASALMYKAQTGQFPEGMEIMTPTNEQGVASNDMLASRVPQTKENESNMRSAIPSNKSKQKSLSSMVRIQSALITVTLNQKSDRKLLTISKTLILSCVSLSGKFPPQAMGSR